MGHIAVADTPLFESDQILDVTLWAPLQALYDDKDEQPGYRSAKLQYSDADGVGHTMEIGVRPRGRTRRNPELCDYPPLRLNFRKADTVGTVFEGQDKLKLVTHCDSTERDFQQYVIQEYLVYRLLNLLTEQSYKARLLRVTYVSTDRRRRPLTRNAFAIEDRGQMLARTGYTLQKAQAIDPHELDAQAANVLEVFQYLIGNTDWSFVDGPGDERCCHNAVLIARDDGPYVPVPFDFDFSGIINASYARPGRSVSIRSVRTRAYRGFCRPSDVLDVTLEHFRQRRDAIYDLYRKQAGLSSILRKRTLNYVDKFYDTINNPKLLERRIIEQCRDMP